MPRGRFALISAIAFLAVVTIPVTAAEGASPTPSASISSAADFEFEATTSLRDPRIDATATLLSDGRVLVVGGYEVASAEAWDPATGKWSPAGTMAQPREGHTAALLSDGRVLVSGGVDRDQGERGPSEAAAEVWDPTTASFSPWPGEVLLPAAAPVAGEPPALPMELVAAADEARPTLLADGHVLVTGGTRKVDPTCGHRCHMVPTDAAWIWDPDSGSIVPLEPMTVPRWGHTAAMLDDGRVLLVGSHTHGPRDRTAEVFGPADE